MDAHDERMNPRPGQRGPGVGQGPAGADPGRDPAGSGAGEDDGPSPVGDPARPGPEPGPAAPGPQEHAHRASGQDADTHTHTDADAAADTSVDADSGTGTGTGTGTDAGQAAEPARTPTDAESAVDDGHPPAESAPQGAPGALGSAPAAAGSPGIAGLSFRYQVVAAVALAAVAVAACVHLALVFLSVAPANTMTKQHGQLVDDWVLPEFEQNWKLFAPNPLQQNIAVEARAQVRTASGGTETTGWYNISALDGAAIDKNPLPSHTQQNELRRAWDFFVSTHDNQNRGTGLRSDLSESYLRRIIVLRLHRLGLGDPPAKTANAAAGTGKSRIVESLQIRSMTTNVQPPVWSGTAPYSDKPLYRTLSWWQVTSDDMPLAAAAAPPAQHTTTEAKPR